MGVYSPKEAKAVAIREALSWLKNHNVEKVQVEFDALLVVQGMLLDEEESSFDLIIHDVKELLHHLAHSQLSFVKRSANQIVHTLTRESVYRLDRREWVSSTPSFICNLLFL